MVVSGSSLQKYIAKIPSKYDTSPVVVEPLYFQDLPPKDPRFKSKASKSKEPKEPQPPQPPKDTSPQEPTVQCRVLKLEGSVWNNNTAQGLHNFIITHFDLIMHEVSTYIM